MRHARVMLLCARIFLALFLRDTVFQIKMQLKIQNHGFVRLTSKFFGSCKSVFCRLGLFHWDFSPTFHFSVSVSCNGLQDTLPGGTVGGVNGCTLTSPPSVSHEELVIVDNESIVIFFSLCLYHFLITYLFSLSFSLFAANSAFSFACSCSYYYSNSMFRFR